NRQQVVENIALDAFIGDPLCGGREAIQLHGDPFSRGLEGAHHQRHFLVDVGSGVQVSGHVGTESADVGQVALVGDQLDTLTQYCPCLGVAVLNISALGLHVVLQQSEL